MGLGDFFADKAESKFNKSVAAQMVKSLDRVFGAPCNLAPDELFDRLFSDLVLPRVGRTLIRLKNRQGLEVNPEFDAKMAMFQAVRNFEFDPFCYQAKYFLGALNDLNLVVWNLSRSDEDILAYGDIVTENKKHGDNFLKDESWTKLRYEMIWHEGFTGEALRRAGRELLFLNEMRKISGADVESEEQPISVVKFEVEDPSGIFSQLLKSLDELGTYDLSGALSAESTHNYNDWKVQVLMPMIDAVKRQIATLNDALGARHDVEVHVRALSKRLGTSELEELIGENQGDLILLYKAIHDAFDRHDLIAPNRLAAVPDDVHRINQIETIIDLFNLKITRTSKDESLDEESRERKLQALQHLMEKDIEALGGAV